MSAGPTRLPVWWTIAWLGGALVLATVAFAPLSKGGFCADGSEPQYTYCEYWERSIVGIDTSFWIWLGATAAFGIIAWIASHAFWRPRRTIVSADE